MEKKSKVAICPRCKCYVLGAHVDYLTKATEKEFTELTNDGFEVKLETIEKTQKRQFSPYSICSSKQCEKK